MTRSCSCVPRRVVKLMRGQNGLVTAGREVHLVVRVFLSELTLDAFVAHRASYISLQKKLTIFLPISFWYVQVEETDHHDPDHDHNMTAEEDTKLTQHQTLEMVKATSVCTASNYQPENSKVWEKFPESLDFRLRSQRDTNS